jgi:serpin B
MKRTILAALACLGLATAATRADQPPLIGKDGAAVVQGNNAFALGLYGELAKQDGNLLLSPYSISSALAMTYAGAKGETAEAMAKTLHFGLPQDRLPAAFKEVIASINGGKDRKYQLVTANRLFGQKGFTFLPNFLKTTETQYGAGLQQLDFARDTEGARKTINAWVEEQTRDKIKELIKQGMLSAGARLVLTNAIYFKASWLKPFADGATTKEAFRLAGGTKADVPMMNAVKTLLYAENDLCQIVDIPYEDGELSMEVLLPKKGKDLADLEKALTGANLDRWRGAVRPHVVTLTLPKFKFTSEFSLRKALTALGMGKAFDGGRADFSGMTTEDKLSIDEVVHKAFVDVHEKGTEAAAATAVVMKKSEAKQEPPPPATFRADRPFVFVLRDRMTGSVLFMGRVTAPR